MQASTACKNRCTSGGERVPQNGGIARALRYQHTPQIDPLAFPLVRSRATSGLAACVVAASIMPMNARAIASGKALWPETQMCEDALGKRRSGLGCVERTGLDATRAQYLLQALHELRTEAYPLGPTMGNESRLPMAIAH